MALPLQVCYRTYGPETSSVSDITSQLSALDIECAPVQTTEAGCYLIVFFSSFSDELIEQLTSVTASGTTCLCVSVGDSNVASSSIWRLLESGATDVVVANERNSAAQIAARVQRWFSVERLMSSRDVGGKLIGTSPAWRRLLRQVVEVASFTSAPILFLGETGTGKDLLARMIHSLDGRQTKRELVTVDCTTIAPELSGSELFGHERGAFTGAVAAREGAFALADKGTLFLDEVGELPLPLQAQLLRAVQERSYKRVGGNAWHESHFRLVCATNRDLEAEVRDGTFRADLYYRIASWVFRPPPLRDRREDILPLARHFLASTLQPGVDAEFDPAVAEYLEARDYGGNVRELNQLVTRMGQRHVGPGPITAGDLPAEEWPAIERAAHERWPDTAFEASIRKGLASGAELRKISQAASDCAIKLTVQREEGNLQRAARRLGITDRALQVRKANGQL